MSVKKKNSVFRILDASANRAMEGLRVCEDFFRFSLDDSNLTERTKEIRHDLERALSTPPLDQRARYRGTAQDVGKEISTAAEYHRINAVDVVEANLARSQQAVRSLEEFTKTVDSELSARLEELRYRIYQLQTSFQGTMHGKQTLNEASLYVLTDACPNPQEFQNRIETLCAANVDLVQLRDKNAASRILLDRCRQFHKVIQTRASKLKLIVNDRLDVAAIGDAHGVHLGQEDFSVSEARTILGANAIVGVTTHNREELTRAIQDGADYVGIGPTFPSKTKDFSTFGGLDYIKSACEMTTLPAFAIGGIDETNLGQVLSAGCRRIAVCHAVWSSSDPQSVLHQLRDRLVENRLPKSPSHESHA